VDAQPPVYVAGEYQVGRQPDSPVPDFVADGTSRLTVRLDIEHESGQEIEKDLGGDHA
jgi:hypothetical protein